MRTQLFTAFFLALASLTFELPSSAQQAPPSALTRRLVQDWSEFRGNPEYQTLQLRADGTYHAMRKYQGGGTGMTTIALYSSGEDGTWTVRDNVLVLQPRGLPAFEFDVRVGSTWLELRRRTANNVGAPQRMCNPRARSVPNGNHPGLGRHFEC